MGGCQRRRCDQIIGSWKEENGFWLPAIDCRGCTFPVLKEKTLIFFTFLSLFLLVPEIPIKAL